MMVGGSELMLRSGFSLAQIVAHLTYHTAATVPISELLVKSTLNSLVAFLV